MNKTIDYQNEILHDRYGLKVAARLNEGAQALPNDILERLRVARMQAVGQRKVAKPVAAPVIMHTGPAAILGRSGWASGWWSALVAAVPAVVLMLGLVAIHRIQNDNVAKETAEVDAALLLDELPPAAYADPGFAQFVKANYSEGQ